MAVTGRIDGDVWTRTTGGGCLMLFGLPFLLGGLGVLAAGLGFLPTPNSKSWDPMFGLVAIPFGLVFAAVGSAIMFGRSGTRIDRRHRRITTWWGVLVPFHSQELALDGYDQVTIQCETRRSSSSKGGSRTYTVYPVRLEGAKPRIDLGEPREYEAARAAGEQVAKFLRLRLADMSTGRPSVREAAELDESLRDRIRRTNRVVMIPPPPGETKTRCDITPHQVQFEIASPRPGAAILGGVTAVALIFPGIVFFTFFLPLLNDEKMPFEVKLLFLSFIGGLFMLLPFCLVMGRVLGGVISEQIQASTRSLRVTLRRRFSTRTVEIPVHELEELVLPGVAHTGMAGLPPALRQLATPAMRLRGIQARSDRTNVEFGAGLPHDELHWIHSHVLKALTS